MGRQGERDDALLLLGISAGDDGDRHDIAAVDREMGRPGRHVHEVPGLDDRALLEALAVPDLGFTAYGVDRGLVARVEMRDAAGAGRDRDQVQAERMGARRPARDAGRQADALLAGVAVARADDHTVTRVGQPCHRRRTKRALPDFAYSEHFLVSYP